MRVAPRSSSFEAASERCRIYGTIAPSKHMQKSRGSQPPLPRRNMRENRLTDRTRPDRSQCNPLSANHLAGNHIDASRAVAHAVRIRARNNGRLCPGSRGPRTGHAYPRSIDPGPG